MCCRNCVSMYAEHTMHVLSCSKQMCWHALSCTCVQSMCWQRFFCTCHGVACPAHVPTCTCIPLCWQVLVCTCAGMRCAAGQTHSHAACLPSFTPIITRVVARSHCAQQRTFLGARRSFTAIALSAPWHMGAFLHVCWHGWS